MDTPRKRRILLIYWDMIPSVRLCGHCQLEWLAERGRVEYRAVHEMKLEAADLTWADIVLLARSDSWYAHQLARRLHDAGRYLIYVIDDDLLNTPPEVSSAAYYGLAEIQSNIRGMIALSNAILSPSPLLLEKYATDGRRAIQIEEPAIDPVEYRPHDPDKPVKIGFAGSIDRVCDLDRILRDALIQIKREYGDRVEFEFFGAIPSFAEEVDATCIPYCESYDEYRRKLNALAWDIGLAPMPDTPFHACKHYNKFVEYAAAGIVGIYSNVYPYTRITALSNDVILCDNSTEDWVDVIRRLIDDREYRETMRHRQIECAVDQLSVSKSADALPSDIGADSENRTIINDVMSNTVLNLLKLCNYEKRFKVKLQVKGLRNCIDALCKKINFAIK